MKKKWLCLLLCLTLLLGVLPASLPALAEPVGGDLPFELEADELTDSADITVSENGYYRFTLTSFTEDWQTLIVQLWREDNIYVEVDLWPQFPSCTVYLEAGTYTPVMKGDTEEPYTVEWAPVGDVSLSFCDTAGNQLEEAELAQGQMMMITCRLSCAPSVEGIDVSSSDEDVVSISYQENENGVYNLLLDPVGAGKATLTARAPGCEEVQLDVSVIVDGGLEPMPFGEETVLEATEDADLFRGYFVLSGDTPCRIKVADGSDDWMKFYLFSEDDGICAIHTGESIDFSVELPAERYTFLVWRPKGSGDVLATVTPLLYPTSLTMMMNGTPVTSVDLTEGGNVYLSMYADEETTFEPFLDVNVENDDVAEILDHGVGYVVIKGVGAGTTNVTVTDGRELSTDITVTVKEMPTIEINEETTVEFGESGTAGLLFMPEESGYYALQAAELPSDAWIDVEFYRLDEGYDESVGFGMLMDMDGRPCAQAGTWFEGGSAYRLSFSGTDQPITLQLVPVTLTEVRLQDANGNPVSDVEMFVGERIKLRAVLLTDGAALTPFAQLTAENEELVVRANLFYCTGTEGAYIELDLRGRASGTIQATVTLPDGTSYSFPVKVKGAEEGQTLTLEQELPDTVEPNKADLYVFTAPEAGQYRFYIHDPEAFEYGYMGTHPDCTLSGSDGSWSISGAYQTDDILYIEAELKKGETVYFVVKGSAEDEPCEVNVGVKKLSAPTGLSIAEVPGGVIFNGTKPELCAVLEGDDHYFEEVTWTSSDESILVLDGVSSFNDGTSYANFIALGTGTVTVTAESESGLKDSVTLTVRDPIELKLDEEAAPLPELERSAFTMEIPEDGYYRLTASEAIGYAIVEYSTDWPFSDRFWLYEEEEKISRDFSAQKGDTLVVYTETADPSTLRLTVSKPAMPTGMRFEDGYGREITEFRLFPGHSSETIFLRFLDEECLIPDTVLDFVEDGIADYYYCWQTEGGYELNFQGYTPGQTALTASFEDLSCELLLTVCEPETLTEGVAAAVEIPVSGQAVFRFTPESDGPYQFVTAPADGLEEALYVRENGELSYVAYVNEASVSLEMTAGTTYELKISNLGEDKASFTVTPARLEPAQSLYLAFLTQKKALPAEISLTAPCILGLSALTGEGYAVGSVEWTVTPEGTEPLWSYTEPAESQYEIFLKEAGDYTITAENENGVKATLTVHVTDVPELKTKYSFTINGMDSCYTGFAIRPTADGWYEMAVKAGCEVSTVIFEETSEKILDWGASGSPDDFAAWLELEAGKTYYVLMIAIDMVDETFDCDVTLTREGEEGLLGDVNGDGEVDANDLTALARHVAKIELIEDPAAYANADVTKDSTVDANDLTLMARYVAKIITEF